MSGHLLIRADARAIPLADESVDCVVTSPPYWGLRNYGVAGQIGLERELDCLGWATGTPCGHCFICQQVAVFREVWRVLKPQGTLWLNMGDKYLAQAKGAGDTTHLKAKDLTGQPWRVAFALQSAGWWLRSEIIWHKPGCMPESCQDRPTSAHEHVFLLAKSERYFYDRDAIREPFKTTDAEKATATWVRGWAIESEHDPVTHAVPKSPRGSKFNRPRNLTIHPKMGHGPRQDNPQGRNKRSVWTVASQPRKEAHFATFPEKLVEPCILAGTSARGVCPDCGSPWVRKTENNFSPQEDVSPERGIRCATGQKPMDTQNRWGGAPRGTTVTTTLGWEPSCRCDKEPRPAVVLDPFAGSGTTCRVAERLGRVGIGLDLNWDYLDGIARGYCGAPVQHQMDLAALG